LQYLIDLLVSAADDIGLRVNAKKTVTMIFSPTDKCKRFCSTFPPFSANGEREFYFPIQQHKREKTQQPIAWRVARKANQPIKAGDPLSYTSVTIYRQSKA